LSSGLPPNARTLVGIGDDAAVLAVPDGRVVATTDFLIEGRHFRRDWASAADVGHKAAARSLADIAAMGAEPSALLVALAAPPDLRVSWARELAEGLAAECARAGASVIGGDTARADCVILAVTGLGDLAGRDPVLRSGASPGDLVAVAGPLGYAAAGLALLTTGLTTGLTDDPLVARLISGHLRPSPPYDAGPEAAGLGATAMIDVSDGLLADLGHVADASGVRIDLDSAALRPDRLGPDRLGPDRLGPDRRGPDDPLVTAARAVGGADRHVSGGRTERVTRPGHGASHGETNPSPPPAPPALRCAETGASPGGTTPLAPPAHRSAETGASPGGTTPPPAHRSAETEALDWVLTGGEDHSLAATFPAGTRLPPRWRVIGSVGPGAGVVIDGQPRAGARGWDHFA
jgi:thiamine-monophosphate kinase